MFFCLGNKFTLETKPQEEGIDVRKELLKFHSSHYSSNVMCLVVLGKGECTCMYVCTHVHVMCLVVLGAGQAPACIHTCIGNYESFDLKPVYENVVSLSPNK